MNLACRLRYSEGGRMTHAEDGNRSDEADNEVAAPLLDSSSVNDALSDLPQDELA